jgi:hypothetical protein
MKTLSGATYNNKQEDSRVPGFKDSSDRKSKRMLDPFRPTNPYVRGGHNEA